MPLDMQKPAYEMHVVTADGKRVYHGFWGVPLHGFVAAAGLAGAAAAVPARRVPRIGQWAYLKVAKNRYDLVPCCDGASVKVDRRKRRETDRKSAGDRMGLAIRGLAGLTADAVDDVLPRGLTSSCGPTATATCTCNSTCATAPGPSPPACGTSANRSPAPSRSATSSTLSARCSCSRAPCRSSSRGWRWSRP